mmetsp:Transcript_790/g.2523  ORF Transcript_790/g.2523 Transcript_790/m.2523 type:complete len:205 (-) Transcript_790:100-714(-)
MSCASHQVGPAVVELDGVGGRRDLEGFDVRELPQVPETDSLVLRGTGHVVAILTEVQALHGAGVALKGVDEVLCLHVEHPHGFGLVRHSDNEAIWVELDVVESCGKVGAGHGLESSAVLDGVEGPGRVLPRRHKVVPRRVDGQARHLRLVGKGCLLLKGHCGSIGSDPDLCGLVGRGGEDLGGVRVELDARDLLRVATEGGHDL